MIASDMESGERHAAGGGRTRYRACGLKALIVEDETLVAWHLESVLQELGFDVCDIVSTGKEAISQAVAADPDVIFMDVNLAGGIDGVEAAKRILEKMDVTIIFVTAYAEDTPTITRIRSAVGEKVVLGKPVTPKAVQSALLRR